MKRVLFVICGICWLMFGAGFVIFLFQYLAQGGGLQDLGPLRPTTGHPVTSGSLLAGLVHGVGLVLASVFCFLVGIGLCSYGLTSHPHDKPKKS